MNRRDFVTSIFISVSGLSVVCRVSAQQKAMEPNLAELAEKQGLKVFNRSVSGLIEGTMKGVRLGQAPGDGVSVFVNDAKDPSLVVDQLSARKKGRIGLWVGNNSGGDFANLRVVPT